MTDKHQRILKAASEIFLAKGYDATTMDQIARRTRLAKGTLYLYFKDKVDLYASLLEDKIEALRAGLESVAANKTKPSHRVAGMILYNLEFIARRYSSNQFIFDTKAGHNPAVLRAIQTRIAPKLEQVLLVIARVIQEGIERNEFRAVDPFDTATRVFSMVNVNLIRRAMGRKPIDPAQEMETICDLLLHGIAVNRRS